MQTFDIRTSILGQVLGHKVLVIRTCHIERKATCVLWLCTAPNTDGVVAGTVEYQLVPAAGKDDTDSVSDTDSGIDAYTLQPSSPSGAEAWQSALEAVSSHLPGGAPQLEQLVRAMGFNADLMFITELQETYQLVTNTAGQVLVLEPGDSPDKLPPTPTGRVMCDLQAHLSIVHAKPSTVITLQNQTVPAVPLTQHIKVQRQQFSNMNVPAHLPGRDVSLKVSLTLGYDEYDVLSTEDQFGIHVYVKNMLVDTFYKVYPAMCTIAVSGHQKRLMGVCMVEGVPDLPQAGFLHSAPLKHVRDQLNSWVAHYLAGQQSETGEETNARNTAVGPPSAAAGDSGDDEPAHKRVCLAPCTSSHYSSLAGALQPAKAPTQGCIVAAATAKMHAQRMGQLQAAVQLLPRGIGLQQQVALRMLKDAQLLASLTASQEKVRAALQELKDKTYELAKQAKTLRAGVQRLDSIYDRTLAAVMQKALGKPYQDVECCQ